MSCHYRNSELRYQDGSKVTCFNPYCDILYLGWSTCLGTVVALVESDVKFTRIAFEVVEALHYCDRCTDRVLGYPLSTFLALYLTLHVDRLTRILRVLHGFVPRGTSDASLFPGCGELKDVFLLTSEAGPFEPYILRSNPCVGIEKYTDANPYYPCLGVGRPQRTSMDAYLGQLMTSTLASMGALDGNIWATGKRPTLHLARQSNPLPEGCAFEMMALRIPGIGQHRMLWRTTCQFEQTMVCTIYPPEYSGPGDYVFKFLGYPQEIEAGRKILAEEIDKVEAVFKTKIPIVHPRQAVFPIPSSTMNQRFRDEQRRARGTTRH
jgi:hypothetical protein